MKVKLFFRFLVSLSFSFLYAHTHPHIRGASMCIYIQIFIWSIFIIRGKIIEKKITKCSEIVLFLQPFYFLVCFIFESSVWGWKYSFFSLFDKKLIVSKMSFHAWCFLAFKYYFVLGVGQETQAWRILNSALGDDFNLSYWVFNFIHLHRVDFILNTFS